MIKFFEEIKETELTKFGGKAASLVKLFQLSKIIEPRFKVPNGFAISSEIDLSSKETQEFKMDYKTKILQYFEKLFKSGESASSAKNKNFVAVRSSANLEDGKKFSFAGQFETKLFVSQENLIEAIKQCQLAAKSEKIISYCQSKNIDPQKIKISIIIQKMIDSEVSGVCFTKHPVTNDPQTVIEAGFGLGEAVVGGLITPDLYILENPESKNDEESQETFSLIEIEINEQTVALKQNPNSSGTITKNILPEQQNLQKISNSKIIKLTKIAQKIKSHYRNNNQNKLEIDIEWALYQDCFYILQARPITT